MEVQQLSHPHRNRPGSSDVYRDKYRRYPAPAGQTVMLEEEELLPPDPELPDSKVRPNRGVKSQEDSGDESLSMGRMSLLCVWGNRSLCEGLSSL